MIWAWKSYRRKHIQWEKKVKKLVEQIAVIKEQSPLDEKALDKKEKSFKKLIKTEPSRPTFQDKTPCRIDYRTGRVERSDSRLTPLWIHVSTLEKNKR